MASSKSRIDSQATISGTCSTNNCRINNNYVFLDNIPLIGDPERLQVGRFRPAPANNWGDLGLWDQVIRGTAKFIGLDWISRQISGKTEFIASEAKL